MRPAWTCLIGIILAIALNKVTSYYTHTHVRPGQVAGQGMHRPATRRTSSRGSPSATSRPWWRRWSSPVAILLSVLIYAGATPIFVAYGVAMCGIGMLTLTGNTISMDVFGPVADNSNGIGEMGYDREEMGEENYKRARQILADLDAVGNTTKAETKGIAIGSAVIAAVSLFASFIAVIAVGSESKIGEMSTSQYLAEAGLLSVAQPDGLHRHADRRRGAVPVQLDADPRRRPRGVPDRQGVPRPVPRQGDLGRHQDARLRPRGRHLHLRRAGRADRPGLARRSSCRSWSASTSARTRSGGFLAGMIVVGQLLAVFMANAGGAWDNAKKTIEDGLYGGKGSEAHKASVTGDTVGDPLKDTAGPALNPLIKVMNMVALLAIAPILAYRSGDRSSTSLGLLGVAAVAWAIWRSKTETKEFREMEAELAGDKVDPSLEPVAR